MKKITENELLEKVSRLKEYIAVVESEQHTDEGAMDTLAKYAAPVGNAIVGGVKSAGNAIANGAQKFFGSTAGKVATGAAAGAGALAAGQALTAPGQAAAPKGTTAKVPAKSDPNVKALQDKLIAAGAKIKADGVMGPATRAAQAQFPNVTTQTDAEKAAAGGEGGGMVAPAAAVDTAPVPASANASSSYTGAPTATAGTPPPPAVGAAPAATGATMDDSNDVYAKPFVPPTATAAAPAAPAAPAPSAAPAPMAGGYGSGATPAPAAPNKAQQPAPSAAPAPMAGGYGSGATPAPAAPNKAQQLVAQAGLPQPGANADDMMKQLQVSMGMDPQKMMADQQARLAALKAKQPAQSPQGTFTQQGVPATTQESVNFRNDELSRIVSLVRYR